MGEEIRFRCPVAARCGGCQMEKMSYAQQLAAKQDWVRDLLRPYCRVDRILGMENPFHYRNKTHAVIASDKRGNVISGVYRMGTHQVVPVDDCLIENEKADEIIRTIRSMLASFKIRPYREDTRSGLIRHVLVRTGHISGQIMVVLVAAQPILPRKNDFVAELLRRHPEITTVVLNVNDRATSMVLGKRDIVLYGEGYIEDTLCGKIFRISPQSFYQVNSVQTEVLYNKALEYAGLTGREVLFDAYCGIGTIGITADGLSTTDPGEAYTKKLMLRRAHKSILLADSGKFGCASLVASGSLRDLDIVITDRGLPPEFARLLKRNKIEVVTQ